jgi:hypothetical protein
MQRPGRPLSPIARVLAAGSLAVAAAVAGSGAAGAYPSPAGSATLTGCGSVDLGRRCLLAFTMVGPDGRPVRGAHVSFTIGGLSAGSITGTATTDDAGVASVSFDAGSTRGDADQADCGRVGTVTGSAGGSVARAQIIVTCSGAADATQRIFTDLVGTTVTDRSGGTITGSRSGSAYRLTVPAGALPPGVRIDVLGADVTRLTRLTSPGTAVLAALEVSWPTNVTASSPVSLVIHDAAFHAGQQVDEVVAGSLRPYRAALVTTGTATITFSGDPAFAVLAPSTAVAGGLHGGAAAASLPSGMSAIAAAVVLLTILLAVPVLRRRRTV